MSDFKQGQKVVRASSIVPGDRIFRTSEEHGDLMLHVESVSAGEHEGQEIYVWQGIVYKLSGPGGGPHKVFLGEITGEPAGRGIWKIPVGGMATKAAPSEDSDYQY